MKKGLATFQLGKTGLTDNFIDTIRQSFKNREVIKISVLQSFSREKVEVKNTANKICEELGKNYINRVIGFTIAIKKCRKAKQ